MFKIIFSTCEIIFNSHFFVSQFAELENELEETKFKLRKLELESNDERQSLNHQIQALQKVHVPAIVFL